MNEVGMSMVGVRESWSLLDPSHGLQKDFTELDWGRYDLMLSVSGTSRVVTVRSAVPVRNVKSHQQQTEVSSGSATRLIPRQHI